MRRRRRFSTLPGDLMTKGRKASAPAETIPDTTDTTALALAGQAATELVNLQEQIETRVRAVADLVGYDLPGGSVDADLIQRDILVNVRRSVEAVLEVGRGLLVLKEACGH